MYMYTIYIGRTYPLSLSMQLQHDEPTRVSTWRAPTSLLSLSLSLSGCSSIGVALLLCYCCCCRCWLSGTCCFARTYWLLGGTQHGEAPQKREFSTHKKKNAGSRIHEYVAHLCVVRARVCVWYTKTEREEKNVASWFFNTSAQLAPSKTHNCNTNEASRGRRSRRRHNTQFEI